MTWEKAERVSAFMGNHILVRRALKGARLHYYLSKVKISATKVKHVCQEEHLQNGT